VHDERSFRAAADRLGYVQSAVSQQIAQLERLVGTRLVERSRGQAHVALTAAGESLVDHARRVLSQLTAAQADLRSLTAAGGVSTLHVGVCQSVATRVLPRALTLLAQRSPDVRVETREALSDRDLFAAVESGELHAAFAELPLDSGPFVGRELLVDPLVLLMASDSALASRDERPSLAEMAERPFVTNPGWRITELVDAQFAAAGFVLDKRYTVGTDTAVQALVAAGLGVAIEPRLAVDLDNPATAVFELDGMMPSCRIACYWHRDREPNPALEAFVEMMQIACGESLTWRGRAPVRLAV
jgi:DNA-binding transcriptional LysR family regulator